MMDAHSGDVAEEFQSLVGRLGTHAERGQRPTLDGFNPS